MLRNILRKFKQRVFEETKRKVYSKIQNYLSIEGWLTAEEALGLYSIAKKVSTKKQPVVVEIGSWKGKSTFCIAMGLQNGEINCIDPFNAAGEEGSKEIYEKNKGEKSLLEQFQANLLTKPAGVKIKALQGYSSEFTEIFSKIDFLFIDGDHSIEGCRFDFENFAKNINPGGYLAFHDYDPLRITLGPTWVIENLVKKDASFSFLCTYDSLAIYKKNS